MFGIWAGKNGWRSAGICLWSSHKGSHQYGASLQDDGSLHSLVACESLPFLFSVTTWGWRKLNIQMNSVQLGPQPFKFYMIRKRNFKKASSRHNVTSLWLAIRFSISLYYFPRNKPKEGISLDLLCFGSWWWPPQKVGGQGAWFGLWLPGFNSQHSHIQADVVSPISLGLSSLLWKMRILVAPISWVLWSID